MKGEEKDEGLLGVMTDKSGVGDTDSAPHPGYLVCPTDPGVSPPSYT